MSSYDYIVVGGGTAGCVLAARLSESPDVRVALVEAGAGEPLPAMATASTWLGLLGGPADWWSVTVKQAGTGTCVVLPRGRGLGGSSSINGMVFVRGHRSSYDAWAADGAKGWGFDDLLPFFRRTERAVGRASEIRGTSGPMVVAPPAEIQPVAAAMVAAAAQAGHRLAGDVGGGLEEGFGCADLNIVDGCRLSAADAYLRPVLDRENLDVITDAVVQRLRIWHGRCVGIDYVVAGRSVSLDCVGEVVLTAGAIGSPHLLLLSGVGPQVCLRDVGITTVVDLPGVGANLHDHPVAGVTYRAARPVSARTLEVLGLIRSTPRAAVPDLQVFLSTGLDEAGTYGIWFSAMAPCSRGSVRLSSAHPDVAPLVDPNYLDDPRDLETMAAGLGLAREIGQQSALSSWRAAELEPGPGVIGAAVHKYLRVATGSYFHPVGTCRIGTDELAVVDTRLRVRGIDALRVADASVMPSIPSANTHATVLAIAERAASLIQD
jgi:choline dehydrogenase-like flavoprotein